MAPKKKNFKKGTHETLPDKKNVKLNIETSKSSDTHEKYVAPSKEEFQKSGKLPLNSNWDRYEEPKLDPHADKMRGDDFDVMLSYSGGSNSHLQLQDEKYWDEELKDDKDHLALDFDALQAALKCIPFQELVGLPDNIFDESQLTNLYDCANKGVLAYKNRIYPEFKKVQSKLPELVKNLNIVENAEESDVEVVPRRNYGIEDSTENYIASLTSSLSLKSWGKDISNDTSAQTIENPPKQSDDLDFLLSLSIPSTSVTSAPNSEKVVETPKTTSVDDWLNSILDD
ncbi:uncharacterized protein LOC129223904 [Uloborus diversus]|uniref:uncharacterized protein LOC129223904 n=1 Tax=Uloborus diversus TaxID=327109 RepID=UPI0024095E71|nr:uncharacterized protein LOC129223904 [Uloborus diversus]XP_054714256.1 uncharacterized protein LOC129223904 [Uloborus diversus]